MRYNTIAVILSPRCRGFRAEHRYQPCGSLRRDAPNYLGGISERGSFPSCVPLYFLQGGKGGLTPNNNRLPKRFLQQRLTSTEKESRKTALVFSARPC